MCLCMRLSVCRYVTYTGSAKPLEPIVDDLPYTIPITSIQYIEHPVYECEDNVASVRVITISIEYGKIQHTLPGTIMLSYRPSQIRQIPQPQ